MEFERQIWLNQLKNKRPIRLRRSQLKLLIERKPFIEGDVLIPVVFNYKKLPEFRMGTMAESIIDFTNARVILPVTE